MRDFLAGDYTLDDSLEIVGIHILLGGGCSLIDWRRVVAKAVESGKTVFLVEHRKVCGDWPEVDVNPDLVLSEQEIDRFVLTLDGGWHKLGAANIHGSITDVRNLFWILRR